MKFKRCDACGLVRQTDNTICGGYRRPENRTPEHQTCNGVLVIDDDRCHAVIHHGPGHQSTTRCSETGSHEMHYATRIGAWRGKDACTDFFDMPEEV